MPYRFDVELALVVPTLPTYDLRDLAQARAARLVDRAALPVFRAPESLQVTRQQVPGRPGDPVVAVWIFRPIGLDAEAPCVIWMHGGGFVYGEVGNDMWPPAELAQQIGAVVISVEYRLAPEAPFPAAVEDCYAALVWADRAADELGISRGRIAVGGQSAGGGLAAALALLARDRRGPALRFQMLDSPVLDDRLVTDSMKTFVDTPVWYRSNAQLSWAAYLGGRSGQEVSPYAAPSRAQDLRGLPPAFVITCEFDPLRDEGIDYAHRLIRAGVPTELHHYPGTFHGSMGAVPNAAISRRMAADRLAAFRRAIGSDPHTS